MMYEQLGDNVHKDTFSTEDKLAQILLTAQIGLAEYQVELAGIKCERFGTHAKIWSLESVGHLQEES